MERGAAARALAHGGRIPAADQALGGGGGGGGGVRRTRPMQGLTRRTTEQAKLGSHGHAEELRSLARETELAKGRNYLGLKDSHEGMPSAEVAGLKAGSSREVIPDLRRGQGTAPGRLHDRSWPAVHGRLHADTIRQSAKTEAAGDPDLQAG